MAAPKLTREQRDALLNWIAADYGTTLIRKWFEENGWPQIADAAFSYYRQNCAVDIERIRQERRDKALSEGLAVKAERIRRLCEHADELEAIKWMPDEKGRLWNEKAWRELVQQIADEMEPKKVQISGTLETVTHTSAEFKEILKNDPAQAQRILRDKIRGV